jgi:hypothetical protein
MAKIPSPVSQSAAKSTRKAKKSVVEDVLVLILSNEQPKID